MGKQIWETREQLENKREMYGVVHCKDNYHTFVLYLYCF